MIPEREKVCEGCDMKGCRQRPAPITKEEWEQLGAKPSDYPTAETAEKMIRISTKPECAERLLAQHTPEEWARMMKYPRSIIPGKRW